MTYLDQPILCKPFGSPGLPGLASALCDVVGSRLGVSSGFNGLGKKAGPIAGANLAARYQAREALGHGAIWVVSQHRATILAHGCSGIEPANPDPPRRTIVPMADKRQSTRGTLALSERRNINRIAAVYGARNASVFGSAPRGEADSSSDLDLLVDMSRAGAFST